MIKIIFVILLTTGCNANYVLASSHGEFMEISTATRFEGLVLNSVLAAYEDFATFGYDIGNFTVDIDVSREVKITFTPKRQPDEGDILGGKTKYGREVSYVMDKSTGSIIKKSFAR